MANIKISELNEKTEVGINDIFPIVDITAGETKKITGVNLLKNQYSLNEVRTNMVWIDGKPIYRKVINFGALPNENTKYIDHNISNIENIVAINGFTKNVLAFVPLLQNKFTTTDDLVSLWVTKQSVYIKTSSDRTSYTTTYVILEYTKTTDTIE